MYCCLCCLCVCCEVDGNSGVKSGGCVVAVSAYLSCTRGSGVLSCAGDVLEASVVRGVVEVCGLVWAGWDLLGVSDRTGFLERHGENGICVCILITVVLAKSGWAAWVWDGCLLHQPALTNCRSCIIHH